MRILPVLFVSVLLASPVAAQTAEPEPDQFAEGLGLLGEGALKMLQGLQSELSPMLQSLSEAIDDVNAYELPEVLENGDILIRRKPTPEESSDAIDL